MAEEQEVVRIEFDDQGRVTARLDEVARVDEAWAVAIGRFIVAFANLEHWTYLYIRTFGSEAERHEAKGLNLYRRLGLTEGIIKRLGLIPEMQVRVDTATRQFRNLTPTRNLLAH